MIRIGFVFSLVFASCLMAQKVEDTGTTIRSETRVVLVDSVVTDKKGGYIHGLTQKDFKVWEDGKEQTINSFLFQADAPSVSDQTHYMVLFFDNSTAKPTDQVAIRKAATQFVEANAGPKRQIAVMEYSRSLQLTQNFTDDKERLKQVIAGIKIGSTDGDAAMPAAYHSLMSRGMLTAVRQAANGLVRTPGRKTLVLLSAGFPTDQDTFAELNTTINACNKNNVAVYPIDVRGLVGMFGSLLPGSRATLAALLSSTAAFQARGGTTTSGGGAAAGASSTRGGVSTSPAPSAGAGNTGGVTRSAPSAPAGGRTTGAPSAGSSGSNSASNGGGPMPGMTGVRPDGNIRDMLSNRNRAPSLIPNDLSSITGPQQVLYALASGTGGFVIANTNDMLGGLEKIGKEQNEYYVLGYSPTHEPKPGTCHTLKVKVEHSGANIRSRTGYCDTKPVDMLSGTMTERDLEAKISGNATPSVMATMQSPFFYTGDNTARVNIALDVPAGTMKFAKEKGQQQAVFNVIGTALFATGGVAAKFSDSVKIAFEDKKQVEDFQKKPYHYEKQFEVAAGNYNLRVAFASGTEAFGRIEQPLVIAPWTAAEFSMSGLALSTTAMPASGVMLSPDAILIEDQAPLIANGVRIVPSASNHFHKSGSAYVYTEIYEPSLHDQTTKELPVLGVRMVLLDAKGEMKHDFGSARIEVSPLPNSAVPVALRLPLDKIEPGTYQMAITAGDTANRTFGRVSTVVIEP